MARRIVATVLTLIIVLLAIVAVPLGLLTAAQDRTDFRDETADGGPHAGQRGRGAARRRDPRPRPGAVHPLAGEPRRPGHGL